MSKMKPTTVLNAAIAAAIAADPGTLAPAALANHVHLIKTPFTPAVGTAFNVANEATFTGGGPKSAGIGGQTVMRDTTTGEYVVILKEPAGGWTWVCTVAPGAPETIYGYQVTDNADAVTLGSQVFPVPIVINGVGDGVDLGKVEVRFAPGFAG